MNAIYNPIHEWLSDRIRRKGVASLARLLVATLPGEPTARLLGKVEWILPYDRPGVLDATAWNDIVAATERGRRITDKAIHAHELWARWQDEGLLAEVTRVTRMYVDVLEARFLETSSCRMLENQVDTLVMTLESKIGPDSADPEGAPEDGGSP